VTATGTGPVWVPGGSGLVGSAVVRRLQAAGREVVATGSADVDLRDRAATAAFVAKLQPSAAVVCAARVGGIGANTASPVVMLSDNAQMSASVLDALSAAKVPDVVYIGSAAMYPSFVEQPIREESLWHGPPEPAHEAYAAAKLLSLAHLRAVRRELALPWVMLVPTNIYGEGDNFDPASSHVVPALLRKFWEARETAQPSVSLWGSGRQRREFVHADDLASAVEVVLGCYDDDLPLNVGAGTDVSIAELATTVAAVVGYDGELLWEPHRPEGPARRVLDSSRLRALGWEPEVPLKDGLRAVRTWLDTALPTGQVRGWR
jgi:GDP-L-fucose synthase